VSIIAGIDPGTVGGVAVLDPLTLRTVHTMLIPSMTLDGKEVPDVAQIAAWLQSYDVSTLVIERAQSMPSQSVASTFKYGKAYGMLIAMGVMMKWRIEFAAPQTWKRHFDLLGMDKTASRDRAIELFPTCREQFERVKDTHRAEAALMAAWWDQEGQY